MAFIEKSHIVKSAEYQNWLVLFIDSLEEKSFYDDKYLYDDKIDKQDRENTFLLSYFQQFVINQMEEQRVLSYQDDEVNEHFYVKLKGNFYDIYTICGQGAVTFIEKLESEPKYSYVFLDEAIPDEIFQERELIQYIVINKDIELSASKLAIHVGHACTIVAEDYLESDIFNRWYQGGKVQKKILLGAHQKKLEELEKKYYSVRDLGLTEVEPDTLIAVSLGIMTRKEAKKIIKGLQLYK